MYENILIPTDGSDAVEGAIDNALDLAKKYDARVHALYVVEPFYAVDFESEQVTSMLEEEGERATQYIEDHAEREGLSAITEIRIGTPHREILDYVDEYDVDLVVMGTHGRTGIDRYLLGSVTEKVVRLCDVPVMTVRMPNPEE